MKSQPVKVPVHANPLGLILYVMPATCGSTLTPDPVQIPVCGVSFELALLFLELGDPRMHAISVATPRSSLPLVNLLRFINNPFAERPQP